MHSKEYTLPNGKKAVFEYDACGVGKMTLECMDEFMGMIADRPQWIPVSERPPKTDNWRTAFNVTTKQGKVMPMEWENTTVRGKPVSRWIWNDRIAPWEVIAWMPLPEKYTESDG
jgi:hypothetical protein